jgi:hypothetical protein
VLDHQKIIDENQKPSCVRVHKPRREKQKTKKNEQQPKENKQTNESNLH